MYLLKLLRSQDLPPKQLHIVFTATIQPRITLCSLSLGVHLTIKASELMPS